MNQNRNINEKLISKVSEIFGQVSLVVGYCRGNSPLKVSPCLIDEKKDISNLIFNKLCINNLATYAYKLSKKVEGNIGMVLKPCDSKAIIQLCAEGLIEREKFRMITVGCSGIIDYKKILKEIGRQRIISLDIGKDNIEVETIDGKKSLSTKNFYAEKCYWCDISDNPLESDVFIENDDKLEVEKKDKYADIKDLENLSIEEIYSYWQEELGRCIRCYACRNVCPMEVCQDQCIVHLDYPNWESQMATAEENKFFQMIRVMHLAGRCVECGECERVCPQNISIFKLMKKMNQVIDELFGFSAGIDISQKTPLLTYKTIEENIEEEKLT